MSESLYRRNPVEGDPYGILKSRRGLLSSYYDGSRSAAVRDSCYVSLTGHYIGCDGGGSRTVPYNDSNWDDAYYGGGKRKPRPDLENVTIEYGGDWGLARKISATIRCYTIADFEDIQRYFLLPGNLIDVEFGYKLAWGVQQKSHNLKDFKVATFGFNTTSEGFWVANFTAVSSATAIKNLDIQSVICNGCDGGGAGIFYITGEDKTKHKVVGIAQLIAADAQKNGEYSIESIEDGDVIDYFSQYKVDTELYPVKPPGIASAAIVIYNGDHLRSSDGKIGKWLNALTEPDRSEVDTTNNQVYLTLGYVVNRIINDQLLRNLTSCIGNKDKDYFKKLKVDFHPKYSFSKIPANLTSGDPTTVLLLGNANYKNTSGEGKNFDKDCKQPAKVKCHDGQGNITLRNILIHRTVVAGALVAATKQRESDSDSTDVSDTKSEVVNIVDFFEKIADHISSCTGGALALRLVEDPDDLKKLIVVDQNFGSAKEALQCVVLDPIDGDGSTRSCDIQSNVGSQEYKAAMFVNASKKGDISSVLRGCETDLNTAKKKSYMKAVDDAYELVVTPGNLGKNNFNGQDINALKSAVASMFKNNQDAKSTETIHYPGLSISADLDGVWGIVPGCAISTTQIPKKWRNTYHSYFMVTRVTHTFQQSDWSTKVDGILAYYPNIDYIEL